MGYACPVCEIEQPDGEHLAHHLAFTAMLHDDEHEAWLDEHAPGWGDCGPEELATIVVEDAPEVDVSVDDSSKFQNGASSARESVVPDHDHRAASRRRGNGLDPEAAAVLQEAQALTRSMLDDAADGKGEDEGSEERGDDGNSEERSDDEDSEERSDDEDSEKRSDDEDGTDPEN